MIKAMGIKIGILLLLLSGTVIEAVPTLTIEPAAPNTDLPFTLTCELASGFISALMNFDKDGTTVYGCASGGVTCNNNDGLADYSEVDWSQTNKGIITISNAAQLRDGGDWTCAVGGGGGTSVAVTVAITDLDCGDPTTPTNGQVSFTTTTYQSTATYSCDSGYTIAGTATTTCQGDGTWSGSVPTCTGTTTTTSTTTTTTPGTTETNTTSGPTNHTGGPTTNTISSTTASSISLPVSVIIAIAAGIGLVIVIGITIAIVCYCKRKSTIKETFDDKHGIGIDNHGIDLKEHSNRDHQF